MKLVTTPSGKRSSAKDACCLMFVSHLRVFKPVAKGKLMASFNLEGGFCLRCSGRKLSRSG